MNSRRVSRISAGFWAIVPFALLLLAVSLWDTPERLPTHWSADLPDAFSTGAGVFSVALSVAGFCAVVAALLALLSAWVPPLWHRWIMALLAGVGATAAATYGAASWGTHLAGSPAQVHVVWSLVPFVLGVLWGWVGYLLNRPAPVDRQAVLETVPERSRVVASGAGVPAPWATRLDSGVMLGTAVFVAVVLTLTAVLSWTSTPLLGVVITVISVLTTLFVVAWSRVEARVDEVGLTIRSTLLPVRLLRLAAEDVVGVEAADLDPMKWGGIGLRWLPGRTAYIVRGGPGMVVHRASGRPFGLEVTEGEEVAAAGVRALLGVAGQAMATGHRANG
ncbi:hypothetical protein FNH13_04720 [Ornithinimicrobium ciconiae]|uniref:DUF1648 domain-containing protein n=1 Tax=Ornithinimicrobium ciconiae TaxID=2594265 RepID=A0A516G879_9MICO|nr:hypothetical protein [Ornithinimicrobium ciconiae]QDO87733.1 hypothetical protein FNH13_04720 [Ornithinimicrobium ciconiae]